VIEQMIRLTATRRSMCTKLLALLVLGVAVLLALSPGPAEAATTFTVNSTGDEGDANLANGLTA
jgi:hypothetical protein